MIDTDERRRTGAWRAVAGRVAGPLVLALAAPAVVSADADGRADWRVPRAADAGREAGVDAPPANRPPVLGAIDPPTLAAGRLWRLHVKVRDPDGTTPTLFVRGLPDGARLDAEGGGWYRLGWTPPAGTAGEFRLTFVAVDALDRTLRSERVVRLRVRPAETASPVPAPPVPKPPPPAAPPEPLPPRIVPPPMQIVSAGRTVSFRIAAALDDDGRTPLLQIDRLPRYASFDANPDGSRTFRWPTGDREQGEHRFRITALHPDDATLRSRADVLVVVGDPTRSSTAPLDEGAFAETRTSAETPEDLPLTGRSVDPDVGAGGDPDTDSAPDPSDGPSGGPGVDPNAYPDADPVADVSLDDEPFLPQAGSDEPDYWSGGEGGFDDEPAGLRDEVDGPSGREPDDPYFEPPEGSYWDADDDLPPGPDGLPFEP